jgi:hypothetical protein
LDISESATALSAAIQKTGVQQLKRGIGIELHLGISKFSVSSTLTGIDQILQDN